jgi:hypothetical protein
MLAALSCQASDHVPCSFMLFKGLLARCRTYLDFLQKQIALGLDVFVQVPPRPPDLLSDTYNLHGLPVRFDRRVRVEEWKDTLRGKDHPVLVKEYHTPAGTLRTEVQQTRDWPYGDHVPFLDDYLEPRSDRFLIETEDDLEPLCYLLVPPTKAEVSEYRSAAQPCLEFAKENGLLTIGGWGAGADMLGWLSGLTNGIKLVYTRPRFVASLLDLIATWNRARMQVVLSSGIDLYIKRAWYENCDFWTPAMWMEFIQPILREDAALAHEAGAKFGYIITSSAMPLIEPIIEAGVDVLVGLDPKEYDIRQVAERSAGKLCLWGGVNGHLTMEHGNPEQVEQEVAFALGTFKDRTGFILSPVDNIRELTPAVEENVHTLIASWQLHAGMAKP